jgi:hypothetical protein
MAGMSVDSGGLWDAVVDVMLAAGHVREGRSRYGDKPALFAGSREIAHLEQDGAIDLRITRAGWARARQDFAADPAVLHDPGRRDWIELRPEHASDLDRLAPLLAITAAANARPTPRSANRRTSPLPMAQIADYSLMRRQTRLLARLRRTASHGSLRRAVPGRFWSAGRFAAARQLVCAVCLCSSHSSGGFVVINSFRVPA